MKLIVSLVVILFVVNVHCGLGEDGSDEGNNRGGKRKECMKQTFELKQCCPMPKKPEDYQNDPECGSLLEGMDDKKGKEKFHAIICFAECMFNKKGILTEEKEVKWDELKNFSNEVVGEAEEFKEVAEKAFEFCEAAFNELKDMPHHKNHHGEKKCSWKPIAAIKCIAGFIVRDCPDSVWTGTDECNALKANSTSMEECWNWKRN